MRLATVAPVVVAFLFIIILSQPVRGSVGVSIEGMVTDPDGLPLPGAQVTVSGEVAGAVADWEGRYRIFDLDPGSYTVQACHLGYSSSAAAVEVLSDRPARAILRLQPHPLTGDPVTIYGSRSVSHLRSAGSVSVARSAWERHGAVSVGDVLREIPGVQVLEGNGVQRVTIRGSPPRTVRIYLDDAPLEDLGTGETDLSAVELERLGLIRVQFEGLGGEVRMYSRRIGGLTDSSYTASVGGGYSSLQQRKSNASGALGDERRWMAGDINESFDPGDFAYRLDDGTELQRHNNRHWERSLALRAGYEGSFRLEGGLQGDRSAQGVPGLLYSAPSPEASIRSARTLGGLSLRGAALGGGISLTGYTGQSESRYTSPALQYNPATRDTVHHTPEDDRQTGERYGVTGSWNRKAPIGELAVDYAYGRDYFLGEDLLRDQVIVGMVGYGSAWRESHSAAVRLRERFGMGVWSWWALPALGVRYTDGSDGGADWALEPSIRIGGERDWRGYTVSLDAGWGSSQSEPPFNARFLTEGVFAVGNASLQPEKGWTADAGARIERQAGLGDGWWVGLTHYQRRTRDLIVWRRNFQGKYYPANLARARIAGIEVDGALNAGRGLWSLYGSYTWMRAVNDAPGDINHGKLIPLQPVHSGNLRATWNPGWARMTLSARGASRRYSTESNQDTKSLAGMGLDPYLLFDLTVSKRFKVGSGRMEVSGGVYNLTDLDYRLVERSPLPGRSFGAEIKLGI